MHEVNLGDLTAFMGRAFTMLGAPDDEARLVADEIATANRLGVDSHGVLRFPQYVRDIQLGTIKPGAEHRIVQRTATTAIVDCAYGFGQVGGYAALHAALEIAAESKVACVLTRRSNHVGRLGAYAEGAARKGFVCLATVTTSPRSHMVVPFGGLDGRVGTNPIAYAAPSLEEPIVSDFATSVFSEGKVRIAAYRGWKLTETATIDRTGTPSRDPAAYYGPPVGNLMPLGGGAGYKGTALGLLAEILSGELAGEEATDADRPANGLFLLLIDPGAFLPPPTFERRVSALRDYVRSSRPLGSDAVIVPGDREARHAVEVAAAGETIRIDDETWQEIGAIGEELGIPPIATAATP